MSDPINTTKFDDMFNSQGDMVERICADLYVIAQDSKYGFARFAVPWGRKGTDVYNKKKIEFSAAMRYFARDCGIKIHNGNFYYFGGKVYEYVNREAIEMAYDMLVERLGIADQMMNKTARTELFINTIKLFNPLRVRNDVIAFSNGVVDLSDISENKMVCHRFDKKWNVVDYHPYPFNPKANAPLFMRFLHTVLPDKKQRDVLQMFLGLGLIQSKEAFSELRDNPRSTVELCLVLLGSGANGKSVLFNVICALFGKSHITNVDYDDITSDGEEGLRGRAVIRSAVFNWSSDSDAKKFGRKNTAMFKKIVSGEPFPYRLLKNNITLSKSCPYLIFSLNELPNLSEGTRGFMRRLQFVNFDVTIPRYKQDPNLAYKIIERDLPGVFNWVVRGAREIRRRHFLFPSSDLSLKTKVRALLPSNPVYAWMIVYGIRPEANAPSELCTFISSDVMYLCFSKFMENNNETVLTRTSFGQSLSRSGFTRLKRSDGIYYTCYGVNEEQLRQPMILDMLHEVDDKIPHFESDGKSFIKDD